MLKGEQFGQDHELRAFGGGKLNLPARLFDVALKVERRWSAAGRLAQAVATD
jgi:hypothetical protein